MSYLEFENPILGEKVPWSQTELVAFCASEECERKNFGTTNFKGNIKFFKKNVKRGTFKCPDCPMALIWIRRPKEKIA
jgi:hypothetical protein